jgi:exosome complex RNA-binding protein Rrp42 (RNase PH superfamily)
MLIFAPSTLCPCNAQVGDVFLVDSSAEEQACASCMVAIAVDKQGSCCGLSFLKPGMLTLAEIQYCQEVGFLLVCLCNTLQSIPYTFHFPLIVM